VIDAVLNTIQVFMSILEAPRRGRQNMQKIKKNYVNSLASRRWLADELMVHMTTKFVG
jgi:hypothetical protein